MCASKWLPWTFILSILTLRIRTWATVNNNFGSTQSKWECLCSRELKDVFHTLKDGDTPRIERDNGLLGDFGTKEPLGWFQWKSWSSAFFATGNSLLLTVAEARSRPHIFICHLDDVMAISMLHQPIVEFEIFLSSRIFNLKTHEYGVGFFVYFVVGFL